MMEESDNGLTMSYNHIIVLIQKILMLNKKTCCMMKFTWLHKNSLKMHNNMVYSLKMYYIMVYRSKSDKKAYNTDTLVSELFPFLIINAS